MLRTQHRAVLALFVTLWVTALALGDLVKGIHLLTEPHVLCLEHGELMEAVDPAGTVAATNVRRQSPAFTEQRSVIEHHAHCAIAAKPAKLVWYAAPASLLMSTIETPRGHALFVFGGTAFPQRSILAEAPKQSPPV